jgi:hypothetical protein
MSENSQTSQASSQQDTTKTHLLEQYKSYVGDLGNIGTRYTTSNAFYLTIISALLAILALTKKEDALSDAYILIRIVVPFFAVLLCGVWSKTIRFYQTIFGVKFSVLREMEDKGLPFHTYEEERKILANIKKERLTENEQKIPFLLAFPFIAILAHALWNLSMTI